MKHLAKILNICIYIVINIFLISIIYSRTVFAQINSSGFALSIPIKEGGVEAGDIICTQSSGFVRCNGSYSTAIYGVIVDNPSVSVEDTELENSRLALTSGIASVKVTSASGNIQEGDSITTSDNSGIGQKATRNGYILGSAMEGYSSDNPNQVGKIQVSINIHPATGLTGPGSNLLQFIRQGLAVPVFEPLESLRYLLAVAIVLIAFTLGMIYFGRASRAGIEAIGRNPLAKRVIQLTVVLNITLTIVIILVGLGIAYLILIF
ncbi:hypothetical protein A2865_02825 [Candidatus Woesebacteria bacterium RIFCSPHIGHO2_01_FULL_39_17]|uniref:Uncharacterized protein n=2 Tax=Candidatus Woeseibacteriota TaxID=1752722 RepID=A0A0G0P512_9BACT|nr:MAG: hypothetical protein US72_C0016G0003 [Microgenomates group bacterium GW2011_GWC1_38_12]KKQ93204.1 MAG: hypothetical protein UT19_C0016G0017 [Candidatus Woesebacteria bacterium GW2011_GWB1_39_10b]OGM23692.1 MAG: hypothetical protein A2865_02825 [Candidatus Woesebacteria bacterium RIFCSPHIGHO2_01_FULL_39_17]OGM61149.1 MAG: hypothetical protein A3A52_00525 [Candidatus Woesebacteria bacterium RIFCSPLOWO2_01_FULL_39_14]